MKGQRRNGKMGIALAGGGLLGGIYQIGALAKIACSRSAKRSASTKRRPGNSEAAKRDAEAAPPDA